MREPEPYVEPVPAYAEPEAEPYLEPKREPEPEPETVAYVEPEPEPEPVAYVDPEPEPEPVAYVEPEPVAYVEPEPESYVEPEPEPEPAANPPVTAQQPTAEPPPTGELGPPPALPPVDIGRRRFAGRGGAPIRREPPPLPAAAAPARAREPRRRPAVAGSRPTGTPAPRASPGRLVALGALTLLVVALAWFLLALFQPFKGDGSGTVSVRVPQGATADDIGALLAKRGVVDRGFFFGLRAALEGKRSDFKAGTYTLKRGMSYTAAIAALTRNPGAAPTIAITIPEGRSRREEAPRLAGAGVTGSYLAASVRSPALDPRRYGAPRSTPSLEGFLFPATYDLRRGRATAARLVAEQLAAFKANFAKVSLARAKTKGLTAYDVLIIASMVEREAQVPKDRPLIAAVIYNRLKDGTPLGIDATTRYALNKPSGALRQSELEIDSPYNTRRRAGLPPTPIGNPGLSSIRAAAAPADVPYRYFVVKPGTCGEHVFAATIQEHDRNVARYAGARAQAGGKSPTTC
jgi:uncharacterized YceG family protein